MLYCKHTNKEGKAKKNMNDLERNKLLEDNLGFIYNQVNKNIETASLFDSLADYEQELMLYILERLDKYNTDKGTITTYIAILCHSFNCRKKANTYSKKHNNPIKNAILSDTINDFDFESVVCDIENINEEEKEALNWFYVNSSALFRKHYFDELTMTELAKQYNVSKQRISEKLQNELKKLIAKFKNEMSQ